MVSILFLIEDRVHFRLNYNSYFDRMTNLILEGKLKEPKESDEGDEIRSIARTHTLSVLRNLDGKRKGQVLRFLFESKLIDEPPIVNLAKAELRKADLILVPLGELYRVGNWNDDLITRFVMDDIDNHPFGRKAWSVDLSGAVLREADCLKAAFILTNLSGADLSDANLHGAILPLSNLRHTVLTGANLTDVDFRRADLTGATVSDDQLKTAKSLEGATMPNGEKYHTGYFSKLD